MAQKYRQKPIVIEAVQYFPTQVCINELEKMGLKVVINDSNPCMSELKVAAFNGDEISAIEGDYIIKDNNGRFSVCYPDIFLQTYERVE